MNDDIANFERFTRHIFNRWSSFFVISTIFEFVNDPRRIIFQSDRNEQCHLYQMTVDKEYLTFMEYDRIIQYSGDEFDFEKWQPILECILRFMDLVEMGELCRCEEPIIWITDFSKIEPEPCPYCGKESPSLNSSPIKLSRFDHVLGLL